MDDNKQLEKFIEENKANIPIYIGIIAIIILFVMSFTLIVYLSLDFK